MSKVENNMMVPYPWTSILAKRKNFNLFGYGSLINQYSSKKDISNSDILVPVMGYGIKRVLNYDPDENVRSRAMYQDLDRGDKYFGVFNLEYTGNLMDKANGVIRNVEEKDYENFVKREVGYALVQIRCKPFDDLDARAVEAFALVAPIEFNGRKLVNNNLLPNVPYYKVCRDGAAHVSQEFLEVWLDTSYLGDGRNVRAWEKEEALVF